ncbi:MAG: hypothetical protein JWS10_3448 [Cypionkella sp.]|nr:hypothetical protein [Cypionkella sp.]
MPKIVRPKVLYTRPCLNSLPRETEGVLRHGKRGVTIASGGACFQNLDRRDRKWHRSGQAILGNMQKVGLALNIDVPSLKTQHLSPAHSRCQ